MTDDPSINNPHDRFVRRFLGEADQMRELIKWQLPAEVIAEIDLESMSPCSETFIDELPERLPEILGLFRRLLPPATALESFETILRYLATGTDRVSRADLVSVVKQVITSQGESIMPTIAEQWKQEGIEKGELIGQILLMEEFLGRESSRRESLAELSLDVLQAKVNELSQAMRNGK